mgnify:CR=1 FL=1
MRSVFTIWALMYSIVLSAQNPIVYDNLQEAHEALVSGLVVQHIDLSKKRLTTLPIELKKFPNIKTLNLNKNKLDSLPSWFNEFQNLEKLTASMNRFDSFPNVILELTNLKTLNLGENNIDGIPLDIDRLKYLESLWLWSNLIRVFPASLSNIESLKYIDLLYNDMLFEEQIQLLELLPNVIIEFSEPCTCEFDE